MSQATPIALAALAALGMNSFYTSLRPVVVKMEASPVEYVSGEYTAHVIGKKVKDCIPVPGSFVGWYRIQGGRFGGTEWIETAFGFPGDETPDSARPEGYQDFGLWRWSDLPPEASEVRVSLTHNCWGKLIITEIGPFTVEGRAT